MIEGDSAEMCAGKFPLVSMGGRAEGLACADPGARTPIGASGIPKYFCIRSVCNAYILVYMEFAVLEIHFTFTIISGKGMLS